MGCANKIIGNLRFALRSTVYALFRTIAPSASHLVRMRIAFEHARKLSGYTNMRNLWQQLRALLLFLFIGAISVSSSRLLAQSTSPVHTGPMPDSRFYSLRFNHILYLYNSDVKAGVPNMQAGVTDVQGGITSPAISSLDWYYQRRIGATVKEESAFLAEAQSWAAEVAPVDTQAHGIIAAIRARNPGGKLAPGEQPPDPPQILTDLQQQRDAITLKHVSNLRAAFGAARFNQLDDLARRAAHLTSHGAAPAGPTGHPNPVANQGKED